MCNVTFIIGIPCVMNCFELDEDDDIPCSVGVLIQEIHDMPWINILVPND